jgi:hypothetical protein
MLKVTNVSAMVHLGVYVERSGVNVESIGREGLDRKDSCTLIATGRWLWYSVMIDGGFVFLSACLMDKGDEPQQLLSVGDCSKGWETIARLIGALERNQVKSLERPIEAGEGRDGFVIG